MTKKYSYGYVTIVIREESEQVNKYILSIVLHALFPTEFTTDMQPATLCRYSCLGYVIIIIILQFTV